LKELIGLAHTFQGSLAFSYNDAFLTVAPVYLASTFYTNPANVELHRNDEQDRHGGDFVVRSACGPIYVDYKLRRYGFQNDICIELVSVAARGDLKTVEEISAASQLSPGWTIDKCKRSNYILYAWPYNNSFRVRMYDFLSLRLEAIARWAEWINEFGVQAIENRSRYGKNKRFYTYCVFVPVSNVAAPAFPEVILNPFPEEVSQ
jgi:hypothetical protein